MATPAHLVSMEELFQQNDDDEVLDRLKSLADKYLPIGWKEWQLIKNDETDSFSVDQSILNKLRFALPTVGIAKAFDPEATSLMERPYRDMKVKMLKWPFCRGLIFSPSELSTQLRGSSLRHELVLQSITPLKDLFLSRKEASAQLGHTSGDDDSILGKRKSRSSSTVSSKYSRLDALEARQERIEGLLQTLVEKNSSKKGYSEEEDENEEYDDARLSDSGSERERSLSPLPTWQAPPILEVSDKYIFDFNPSTKQLEPLIPEPDKVLSESASRCQRFGSSAWNKVRYTDAQKKLQAGGIFSALQPNWQLTPHGSSGGISEYLAKSDASMGLLCHGLLLQRQALTRGMQDLMQKHPEVTDDIKAIFASPESQFKSVSDDLLQYVCGKRAEIIENRRRLLEPSNPTTARLIRDIHPSESHLYEERKLESLLASQPGCSKTPYKSQRPFFHKQREAKSTTPLNERKKFSSSGKVEKRYPRGYAKKKGRSDSGPDHKSGRSHHSSNQKNGFRRH